MSSKINTSLQTAKTHALATPQDRHNANKQIMQNFYNRIQIGIEGESKFHSIANPQFNNWYLKPKYWYACRSKSNEANSENQLIRIKVSNRQFCQINNDNKEVAIDLKSTWAVVAQSRKDYAFFVETLQVCQEIENELEAQKSENYKLEIQRYRQRSETYFGLFTPWHFQNASIRLCVLVKDKIDKDRVLFIYNRESNTCQAIQEARINSSFLDSTKQDHLFMKQIIKVHQCKQIYERELAHYKNSFLKTVKANFADKMQRVLQQQQRKLTDVLQNKNLARSFQTYDLNQSSGLLVRWKNQSAKLLKNKRLFVEVLSIWINKAKIPKNIVLTLRTLTKEGKEEIQRKQYFYKTFDAEYGIYQQIQGQQKQSKCLSFQIEKSAFSKQIFIEVEVTYQNGKVVKFKNTFVHFKLEGKDAFTHQLNLYSNESQDKQNDCFIFLKTKESRLQSLNSIVDYHQRVVFDQVGKIPTKYRSCLTIDYNPTTYGIVRQLLLPDTPEKISKVSYQQAYLALVHFIQQQQNKSQLLVANLPENKLINKSPMKDRLSFYEKQVLKSLGQLGKYNSRMSSSVMNQQQGQIIAYIQAIDPKLFQVLGGKQFVISQLQYKNLTQDLSHYKPLNEELVRQSLVKYIYFVNKVPFLKEFPFSLRYISNLVPIIQKYLTILFNSRSSNQEQALSKQKYTVRFFVFILIIAKIYPYCDSNNLKKDLLVIRSLVKKDLSYYNDSLNRLHIGLQNAISTHLLNLFTDLSEQLTFRIWDFLISSQNTNKARIIVAFTLLTYFQATKNLPIIPINQFMAKVEQNYAKLVVVLQPAAKESKAVQSYFANEQKKAKRLERLIKDNRKSVADDKYIQRIVFGQTFIKEEDQQKIRAQYEPNKVVQKIKQLSYPLPRPNYFGKPITQLICFVHSLNILQNLNLVAQKYSLRFSSPMSKQRQQLFIVGKNHFYNESFKLPFDPVKEKAIQKEDMRMLIVQVVQTNGPKAQRVQLSGKLNFSHFQKDKAYKTLLTLTPTNKHNKGQTILSLSICLKSSEFNSKLQSKTFTNLQQLSYSVFEYQIGQLNESMHKLNDLNDELQQVKNPLDEFEANQNKRVNNSAINYFESDWLENSRTSIEELKTIFYHIFPQEKDKDLKLEFSKIYQIFSQEHNMQSIYLTEVMARLILATNITRKKKLTYLYCLGVHYQNSYSKKLTSQTVNSILRLILKQKQITSACPYEIETCGNIIEAYFFSSSLKNPDEKTYFTEIIQDWLYICTFKFSYCALILGSSQNLSILKSLFDASTLQKIQSQPECRFEIVYEVNGNKYLWSVVVQSKSFNIIKRGTKFLNNFDGYSQLKYLDSTQEYLYNCENVIGLQVHKGYTYAEFTQIMLENELVKYALQIAPINSSSQQKSQRLILKDVLEDSRSSNFFSSGNADEKLNRKIVDQLDDEGYESWVLHRSHNCLENWRKCSIVTPGPILSEIRYQYDEDVYTVNTIDLISMDEISVQEDKRQAL